MITKKDSELIQKFLHKNYPVQRIKTNRKFKRAIIFDNGNIYCLSNDHDKIKLKKEMVNLSMTIFGFDEKLTKEFINGYLNF